MPNCVRVHRGWVGRSSLGLHREGGRAFARASMLNIEVEAADHHKILMWVVWQKTDT